MRRRQMERQLVTERWKTLLVDAPLAAAFLLAAGAVLTAAVVLFMPRPATAWVGDGAVVSNGAYANPGGYPGTTVACLNCHDGSNNWANAQYKAVRTGHRNMLRKVGPGGYDSWKGPDGVVITTGGGGKGGHGISGQPITWLPGIGGNFTIAGCGAGKCTDGTYPIFYIWGDWIDPAPHAVDVVYPDPLGGTYPCAACHVTGYQTDGSGPEPYASFPSFPRNLVQNDYGGSGLNGATWYGEGIQCERCHGEAVAAADPSSGAVKAHNGATGVYFKDSVVTGGDGHVFRAGSGMQVCFNCHAFGNSTGTAKTILTKASAGFLNSPHARYSGSTYATVGRSGYPNVARTGDRPDLSDGTKFNTDFMDNTYSVTMPRFNYLDPTDCIPTVFCQGTSPDAVSSFEYTDDLPTCTVDPVTGLAVTGQPTDVAVTPTTTFTFPPATKTDGGCTLVNYGPYTAVPSVTNGQNLGCTKCHDVHDSVAYNDAKYGGVNVNGTHFNQECTDCHNPAGDPDTHAPPIDLTLINHLGGQGTPLQDTAIIPSKPCEICHMPNGMHVFRINTDPSYVTSTGGVPNPVPDDTGYPAVWNDLDLSCGKCHGGGAANTTTGSITMGSTTLTVADATGFTTGQSVTIAGAGSAGDVLATAVASVVGTTVTVVDTASTTVTGAAVAVHNPTTNGAPYLTKVELAPVATGMHRNAGLAANVAFTSTVAGLTVNVTQAVSCAGACPSVNYDWDWGDGSAHGAGPTASHTYPTPTGYCSDPTYLTQPACVAAANQWVPNAAVYPITLTVTLSSAGVNNNVVGTSSRNVTVTAPDSAPTANATCTWTANIWTLSVLDTSTDTDATGVATVVVDWGDLSTRTIGAAGGTFTHSYLKPGSYTATLKAIDSALQMSPVPYSCAAVSPAAFMVTGTVVKHDGTTGLASAVVQIQKGGLTVRTVYTAGDGTFSATGLAPAPNYTIVVNKLGYTFPVTGPFALGPSSMGNTISASSPSLRRAAQRARRLGR